MDPVEFFQRESDRIDCDEMALRDWLDTQPMLTEVFGIPKSPWRDGAFLMCEDLLKHRHDRVQLLSRLFAWERVLR